MYLVSFLHSISWNTIPPSIYVKECAMILAPFFAYVFNDSLQKGHLSPEQKRAIIYPGLEKPSLNPDDLANYHPISNLSFVSKLLERAVHAQLLMYLYENELLPSVQSAYRQFFSTGTAGLKVVSDVLTAMDRGPITLYSSHSLQNCPTYFQVTPHHSPIISVIPHLTLCSFTCPLLF